MAAASLKDVTEYFRQPGETLSDFTKQWKALTDQDKADLREGLGNGSFTY